MNAFLNIAAYKFTPLANLKPLRERLLKACLEWDLKGTILLSPEGINLFLAGHGESIDLLLRTLRAIPGLEDLQPKVSESEGQPFSRMLVRIKKEIITFGVPGVEPGKKTSPKIAPRDLKQWLDEGRPITLLDTRNDYEVKLGTFKQAHALGIDHFREFPEAVRQLPGELKARPIVMFCTGGIRCEKAGPFMEMEGFQKIFQLEGGILKYFEECGSEHYEGECFVFDQRVGVDPSLQETASAQCFSCQTPLTATDQLDPRYVHGQSCPSCYEDPVQRMQNVLAARHARLRQVTSPLPGSQPYNNYRPLNIPALHAGKTLIEALCGIFPQVPRAEWESRCDDGYLMDAERRPIGGDRMVSAGERYLNLRPATVEPEVNAAIRLLYEDEALIVLDKPAPLPTHPGGRFHRNTLQFILNTIYAPQKIRPAHRLDANTTGIMVLTRTRHFAGLLQAQFARREVEKTYLARVVAHPPLDLFACDAPISGEPSEMGTRAIAETAGHQAHTLFRVIRRSPDGTSLLEACPLTGRTNQIRIHLQHLGWPIDGDEIYRDGDAIAAVQTSPLDAKPMCLHAWRIRFKHPISGAALTFEAELPSWVGELPAGLSALEQSPTAALAALVAD